MKKQSERMSSLPPYLFARIEAKIAEAKEKGVDIISLGIGDPDLPTPDEIIDVLTKEAHNPVNHQYPSSVGMLSFREAVAKWYADRFGVELDPKKEVVTLIGSKEGVANINYCYVNPGDVNLVPDPGYPVYGIGTLLAGGEPYYMPLLESNKYLPDFNAIPQDVVERAKILWLNYPNNPTGACADEAFFAKAIEFAKKNDLIICHDNAYSEVAYEDYKPVSFLQIPGAKEVGIEFNSLSKPFNMTGWRIGFAVGNPEVIETLARYKSNVDSGAFQAVQYAGMVGLENYEKYVQSIKEIYQERRDVIISGLREMGWDIEMPKATFYVWAPVPKGYTSAEFAELVLEKAGVIITPGNGYGENGEGYFRISLTIDKERMLEALARMKDALGDIEF